jgi:hypothetical protein
VDQEPTFSTACDRREVSLSCFGFGNKQTNDLRKAVGEQKIELERLQRENASLVAQIEAHKRADSNILPATGSQPGSSKMKNAADETLALDARSVEGNSGQEPPSAGHIAEGTCLFRLLSCLDVTIGLD